MSKPLTPNSLYYPTIISELQVGALLLRPHPANDFRVELDASDAAADDTRTSDPAFRARFWRLALPGLALFWGGIATWVLS